MSENIGGAGPSLAAHSKDASTSGQTPASEVTGQPTRRRHDEEPDTVLQIVNEVQDFVRQKPITAVALSAAVGVLISRVWRSR
jgi:ElaB/YqjD/DUF883 family membrane-anchored ribosome-binding protein